MILLGCHVSKPANWLALEYVASPYNTRCRYKNDYTLEARLKMGPFESAKKVRLVSYEGGPIVDPLPGEVQDSALLSRSMEILGYSGVPVYEVIELSNTQLDYLTNILYNYAYWKDEKEIISFVGPSCYSPQHKLQFFKATTDKRPFAEVEICLECLKYRVYPNEYNLGIFCESKYELLREFFRQAGIEHGIN